MKKTLGFKKLGSIHAGAGHVKAIRMGSEYGPEGADDGLAEITVHHGKAKPFNSAKIPHDTKTSRVHIPAEHAKKLKIGQRVKVHLEPI